MSQSVEAQEQTTPAPDERAGQLRGLTLQNFLSYGPEGVEFTFGSLNVLVGPNGSGKTNLIEALRVIRSTPKVFGEPMLSGGGVDAYIWHGESNENSALLKANFAVDTPFTESRHEISFWSLSGRAAILGEFIGAAAEWKGVVPEIAFERQGFDSARLSVLNYDKEKDKDVYLLRNLRRGVLRADESGLENRRDHEVYPALADIADFYESIAIYGEWTMGRGAAPRQPVLAGTRSDVLLEDASNLAQVLSELRRTAAISKIRAALRRLKATYEDFSISPIGTQYQLFVEEEGVVGGINAMRLSDGTLRFLALAAVLLHPKPPALVVIDEPELGMHPDLIEAIAEMIAEAATRTQLIIATHSPDLLTHLRPSVDRLYAFQAGPEGTSVRGFSREALDAYLVDQPLGELWRQGDFGGNRF